MLAAVLATFCFGMVLLVADFVNTRIPVESGLARNPYGGGEKIKELDVAVGRGKREKISVKVSEQAYSGDELKSMFKRCAVQLDKVALGKNESFDHIEEDMELAASVPGFPVEISWEHDRYDVMNVCGEINQDRLAPEGTLITLKAVLTYTQNPKEQMLYEQAAVVFPKTLDKKDEQLQNIERAVAEADRETQTEKELILPREAGGRNILFFFFHGEPRGSADGNVSTDRNIACSIGKAEPGKGSFQKKRADGARLSGNHYETDPFTGSRNDRKTGVEKDYSGL